MPDLPNDLALTSIADGADVTASPLRNNFSGIQTAVNALIAALSSGTAGQALTATDTDTVSWVTRPSCRVTHDAAQAVSNNTATALAFNTERWDTGSLHDTSSNNSRLTCQTAGIYHVYGNVEFAANSTGAREVAVKLNGTTTIALVVVSNAGSATTNVSVSTEWQLAANDYVQLVVTQTSGGSLNVNVDGDVSPEFGMTQIV